MTILVFAGSVQTPKNWMRINDCPRSCVAVRHLRGQLRKSHQTWGLSLPARHNIYQNTGIKYQHTWLWGVWTESTTWYVLKEECKRLLVPSDSLNYPRSDSLTFDCMEWPYNSCWNERHFTSRWIYEPLLFGPSHGQLNVRLSFMSSWDKIE